MCTFENWIRLSKPFRFQTDQKLAVGYFVTWFGEYFETVLVVNGRHLMWILPLTYSCLFQTLTERMKNLFFPTEVLYHSWSLLIAGEIKCRFRADILVGLKPFNFRISICNLFVYFSFPFQFGEYSAKTDHLNFKAKMNESSSMGTKNILYKLFPRHDSSRSSSPDAVDISFSLQQLFLASLPVLWPVFMNVSDILIVKTKQRLQTRSKILLACLALTDLLTGLILQPACLELSVICLLQDKDKTDLCKIDLMFTSSFILFWFASVCHLVHDNDLTVNNMGR